MKLTDKILNESKLYEGGYARLMTILSGLAPKVQTFGIVTWENPQAQALGDAENSALNNKLKKYLKDAHHSYRQIKGKYGSLENPFFINNITKQDIMDIGKKGNQETIIFGEVVKDGGVEISLVNCTTGSVEGMKKIWKSVGDEQDDFYSEFKGRKFVIPFFEAAGEVIAEANIFHEVDYDESALNEIYQREFTNPTELINENRNAKSKYLRRGALYMKIRELK